jgi:hypothetical protein
MRMLCGLSYPSSGKGFVAGYDISKQQEAEEEHRLYESKIFFVRRPESMGKHQAIWRNIRNERKSY